MEILEIKELKKRFKNVNAVDGLSLKVKKGEIHGILGPNGAGKSTTMGCILRLLPYDSGSVTYDGKYSTGEWKQNIGYVPQELALYDELSAEQNIRFFGSLYGTERLRERVEKALDFVGLLDVKKKKAGTFSGGMKRRLNLACGIVHEPKLVIMDEPTVGIDPQSRNRILENVKALNEAGTSVIYTSHYMPEIEQICSRMTVIDHGKVVAAGTKQEIVSLLGSCTELHISCKGSADTTAKASKKIDKLKDVISAESIGETINVKYRSSSDIIGKAFEILVKSGLGIESVTTSEPSLEETFLTLTGKKLRDAGSSD